jgi:hypothetical protein
MELSISHEVADFIDYGSRLLRRIKADGLDLSKMEIRILSAQLRQLSTVITQLDDARANGGNRKAA